MAALRASKSITPEDLLALVRRGSDRFQRQEGVVPPQDGAVAFTSRRYIKDANEAESAPDHSPAPDPLPAPILPADAGAPGPSADFTPRPEPQSIDLEAERQSAWQAGFDAACAKHATELEQQLETAREEARAEAFATLDEAKEAFDQAVQRFSRAEDEMTTALQSQLEQAIRNLAAERAGQKIDETPKPFLRRIEKMVREIGASAQSTVVQMHPADLMAIRPHIKTFSPLTHARLSPDPKLGRGDVRLKMDMITFSDCIAERSGGGLT